MGDFEHAGRPGMRGGSAPSKMQPLGLPGGLPRTPGLVTPAHVASLVYSGQVYGAGKGDKHEHVIVWDRSGNKVHSQTGDVNGIKTGDHDFRGMSMVHNHPTGSSFSGADLRSAQKFGLASTEVVDDNFVYTLTPGDGCETFSDVPDDLGSIWDTLFNVLTGPHGTGYDEASSDALMQQVAAQTGVRYTKRPR
jgi:hypothetical protein